MKSRSDHQELLPPKAIEAILRHSRTLVWARISRDGTLLAANPALERLIGSPATVLPGKPIFDILAEQHGDWIREQLVAEDPSSPEPRLTNFVSPSHEVHSLRCQIFPLGEDLVLVGERDVDEDREMADQLLRLNNELSVLSRENARRSRELEAARRKLEETLAELENSHWHLRKIQENIPLCMRCGKMKTGEAEWASLVDYLRSNEILVSHGYCPTCSEAVLAEEES